jgi:arginyl-tRNA--protein-N-Asp/Glu arginylyltransferase
LFRICQSANEVISASENAQSFAEKEEIIRCIDRLRTVVTLEESAEDLQEANFNLYDLIEKLIQNF